MALSGITANPTVGAFRSLSAKGGTTILTEVPEMFGAETILMDRWNTWAVWADREAGLMILRTTPQPAHLREPFSW